MSDQTMSPYRELDAEARNYVDSERVIALAKQRRASTAAVAAIPLALAGLLGAVMVLGPGTTSTPPAPAAQSARPTTATESGMLRPPDQLTALPPGPAGRAAFAYTPCRGACDGVFVALRDGRQFVLPKPAEGGASAPSMTISWDGSWLGYQRQGQYLVRSLTDTRAHLVTAEPAAAVFPVAWSSDSRRLLLERAESDIGTAYIVLDVDSGQTTRLTPPKDKKAFGILADGTVLFRDENQTGPVVTWSTSAGTGGTVDVTAHLRGESVRSAFLAPDDRSVYVVTARLPAGQGSGELAAVIHADVEGKVLGRYEVPDLDLENQYCDVQGPVTDGFAFSCRNGSGSLTTLVTVSASGVRQGVKIAAQDWPNRPTLAEIVIPG